MYHLLYEFYKILFFFTTGIIGISLLYLEWILEGNINNECEEVSFFTISFIDMDAKCLFMTTLILDIFYTAENLILKSAA